MSDLLDQNGPPSEVDVSLIEMSESKFDKLMQSGAPQKRSASDHRQQPARAQETVAAPSPGGA
ncbi:MAG: hypothetical protein IPF55_09285 [Rhodoferax sp.]|nr:hypothetical protein [Rhodoferax sp.]